MLDFCKIKTVAHEIMQAVERIEDDLGYTTDELILKTELAERIKSLNDIMHALYVLEYKHNEGELEQIARLHFARLWDSYVQFHGTNDLDKYFDRVLGIIECAMNTQDRENDRMPQNQGEQTETVPVLPASDSERCQLLTEMIHKWNRTETSQTNDYIEEVLLLLAKQMPHAILQFIVSSKDEILQTAAFKLLHLLTPYPVHVWLRQRLSAVWASLSSEDRTRVSYAYENLARSLPTDYDKVRSNLWGNVTWQLSGYWTDGRQGYGAAILCVRSNYCYCDEYILLDPTNWRGILPALCRAEHEYPDARHVLGIVGTLTTMENPHFMLESLACQRRCLLRTQTHHLQKRFVHHLRFVLATIESNSSSGEKTMDTP